MKLQGTRQTTETVEVEISSYKIAEKLRGELVAYLRPDEVSGYDDWYVTKEGDLVGVTEYHHGSDSYTTVGTGYTSLYTKMQAITEVCTMLKEFE